MDLSAPSVLAEGLVNNDLCQAVFRPVRHPIFRPGNLVAAVGVGLIGHEVP